MKKKIKLKIFPTVNKYDFSYNDTYYGELNSKGIPHGEGTLTWHNNGWTFSGQWKNGKKHGYMHEEMGQFGTFDKIYKNGKCIGLGIRANIDKFIKLINKKKGADVYNAIEKSSSSKIDIFEYISNNEIFLLFHNLSSELKYDQLFRTEDTDKIGSYQHIFEYGYLKYEPKTKKKQKNELKFLISINSINFNVDFTSQNLVTKLKKFKFNDLYKIVINHIKYNWPSKISGRKVFLNKKLKWNIEDIKPLLAQSRVKFIKF